MKFYEKGTKRDASESFKYGVTNIPGMEYDPSPNNNVYIFTASFLSPKIQARNTAHEGYGHAYFYELSKTNPSIYPNHTRGVVEYVTQEDPEWGFIGFGVFGLNNFELEKQIKTVEKQAIMNYEKRNP